ncbi:MAG: type II toxin-antitoxin system VapC family toxin [Nitrospirota bacterium]
MAGSPVKIILDTSIYIPFINAGITHPILELEYQTPLLYMSAVVIEELYAGTFDNVTVKLLDRMYETFYSIDRIVVPDASDWQGTGKVIAKLGRKYGFEDKFLSKITNDVLIAFSAKRIGAFVVTHNTKDFLRIKEFVNFKLSP